MQTCQKCNIIKQLNYFHKNKKTISGYSNQCKNCLKKECIICNKIYSSKRHLLIHISIVHNKEKFFKCEYCDFTVSEKGNLKKHKCYSQRQSIFSESDIQKKIEIETNGCSRKVDSGVIDIVSENEIIEIKNWTNWKMAIGQIISYSVFYPNLNKRIHFFGIKPPSKIIKTINLVAEKFNILITSEE